jgi:hypothetical protein
MMRTPRGQATTELALGSLLLVTVMLFGIYFGEVTFGALKVQEAANSALFDLTDYKAHTMTSLLYSESPIGSAVTQTQTNTFNDYQDFDGRTSPWGVHSPNVQHVFTKTTGMTVKCSTGGAPAYLANPLLVLAYDDPTHGASCSTSAEFLTVNMPSHFADSHGMFQVPHWSRASIQQCSTGTPSAGACKGRNTIMLDDWGLTGTLESLTAPGLPYGIPSANLAYWWTAYKAYKTSYLLSMIAQPALWSLPASQLASIAGGGLHPMSLTPIPAIPLTLGLWNESNFYMSFDGSTSLFEATLMGPLAPENGFAGRLWESTPFLTSIPLYFTAYKTRVSNGGCYLGTKC